MPQFQLYYKKDSDFLESCFNGREPLTTDRMKKSHVMVGHLEADDLDQVYHLLQEWAPDNGMGSRFSLAGHMSMSIGDVIRDPDDAYWEVSNLGFRRMTSLRMTRTDGGSLILEDGDESFSLEPHEVCALFNYLSRHCLPFGV